MRDVGAVPAPLSAEEPDIDWMKIHEVNNLGRRAMAAVIDFVLLGIAYVICFIAFGRQVRYSVLITGPHPHYAERTHLALTGVALLAYIAACFGYFIVLERWLGWTIGKLLFSLRVVNLDEERISLRQSLVRNLMRVFDGLPYVIPYLMGYARVRITRDRQRFGDRLAKTIVIDSV